MALCSEPLGEEVARAAQFIEAEEIVPGPLESLVDQWNRTSSDVNRFARENPGAALGAGLAAGVLIGLIIGSR
ncbi:MAG TPA: hypothetical protein VKH46_08030 [Thermoanaerobaculia bacterium]|jgi:ElaB/YqjD/DUF883 family membrane-anchored ribosome-binding protein|nr:hypothetical protein [Thermoanaerobaculia bacterium]